MTLSLSEDEIVNLSGLYSVFAPFFFASAHRALLTDERSRIDQAIAALEGSSPRRGRPAKAGSGTRTMSAAARKRISAAMRMRWAQRRGESVPKAETIWLISMRDSLAAERQRRIPCSRPPRRVCRGQVILSNSQPATPPYRRLSRSRDVGSCTNLPATKLELRVESLQRVRIALRQLELRFLNHLLPQGIRIRIENRSGIPLKNEP
jgi:hypothetical protein